MNQSIFSHDTLHTTPPKQNKALNNAIATFIFLITLIVYGGSNNEWFFDGDDWGLVHQGSQCRSVADFFGFINYGKLNELATPDASYALHKQATDSFFSVYYRPIPLMIHALLYQIFGTNAYAYFILIVLLHALAAALLFLIFSAFAHKQLALLSALFFAFHPTLYGWFGKIDTLQSHLNLLFCMALLWFLYLGIKIHSWKLISLSWAFFGLCLFTRETFIVLPLALFFWLLCNKHLSRKKILIIMSGFCAVIIGYVIARAYAYPFAPSTGLLWNNTLFSSLAITAHNAWHFLYDSFWLQWFSWKTYAFVIKQGLIWPYRIIKVFLCVILTLCVVTNTRKQTLSLFALAALILWWPPAYTAGSRLYYESVPFFIAAIVWAFHYSTAWQWKIMRSASYVLLSCLIIFNDWMVTKSMAIIMQEPAKTTRALKKLQQTCGLSLFNRPLMLIRSDSYSNSLGVVQALELYSISAARPRFVISDIILKTTPGQELSEGSFAIASYNRVVRLVSLNPETVWFENVQAEGPSSVEQLFIHQAHDKKIYDLSVMLKPGFWHKDLVIVPWHFDQEIFIPLINK